MKRFTIFKAVFVSAVLSLLCMMSVTAAGDDPKRDIILHKVIPTTRSIIKVPEASISHEVLMVSFSSSGTYSMTVMDIFGVPVYISTLPADGMEYSFDLSGIGEGYANGYYYSADFNTNEDSVLKSTNVSNDQESGYYQYLLNQESDIIRIKCIDNLYASGYLLNMV